MDEQDYFDIYSADTNGNTAGYREFERNQGDTLFNTSDEYENDDLDFL